MCAALSSICHCAAIHLYPCTLHENTYPEIFLVPFPINREFNSDQLLLSVCYSMVIIIIGCWGQHSLYHWISTSCHSYSCVHLSVDCEIVAVTGQ